MLEPWFCQIPCRSFSKWTRSSSRVSSVQKKGQLFLQLRVNTTAVKGFFFQSVLQVLIATMCFSFEASGNLLVLVDQHAAHERVRLENLIAGTTNESVG